MNSARSTINNSVYSGRLRQFGRGTPFIHAPKKTSTSSSTVRSRAKIPNGATVPASPRLGKSNVLQRGVTNAPKVAKVKVKKPVSQKLLISMAAVVFMAGLGVALLGFKTNKEVVAQVKSAQTSNSLAEVSEDKPSASAIANHKVDPMLPRYIRIPSISVFSRVRAQGLDKTGALKAPGNVHDTGWYQESSKPGQGGAVLLDGHVAGPTAKGVFNRIKDLKPGDTLEVERGDGSKFNYKVVKSTVTNTAQTNMSDALLPVTPGKSGLNLITCTGKYDHKSGQYDQRIIVFAVQI